MTTTATTAVLFTSTGYRLAPRVERIIDTVNLTTGSTVSGQFDTRQYTQANVTFHVSAIGTGSTLTVSIRTGDSTTYGANVDTESGASSLGVSSTGLYRRAFPGLNRLTEVKLVEAGGSTESTGVAVDVEFI